jgi:hydroxypyruvate reductase
VSDHPGQVPERVRLLLGSHPLPDERSLRGGEAVLAEAAATGRDETLLVLVSGGGSALVESLPEGVSLADTTATQQVLLTSGVPIEEVNTVRRHLSLVKNGGVLRAAGAGRVVTLLISDVIDGPPSAIASGPTLADRTSPADALDVVEGRGLRDRIPHAVVAHLRGEDAPGSPAVDHRWAVLADVAVAAGAAYESLAAGGLPARIVTTALRGEARVRGRELALGNPAGVARLAAGETTVTVTGDGRGGRNQEGALAAALALEGREGVFAGFGTDGIDGPTDAAGAIVDSASACRIRGAGIDPVDALAANDSHSALEAAGDLVRTGPTGTNVGDLWIAWRSAEG